MHKRFVANIVSRTCLIVCFIMMVPLTWAVKDDIHSRETMAFILSILFGMIIALSCLAIFRLKKEDYQKINAKDGLAIVGLSWLFLSFLGALPLLLSGVTPTFTDAFFEIVSGFTTTGASIFTDVEILPVGILFWRSMTHFIGGIGIVVLYIVLLPAIGANAYHYHIYTAEASVLTSERIEPKLKESAQKLLAIYLTLTAAQILLMGLGGMPWFDALCHTFGTTATGGFSTKNASLGAYSAYLQWVTIVFMILGGTNFILHFHLLSGRPQYLWKNEEFQLFLIFIVGLSLVFGLVLQAWGYAGSAFRDAAFSLVSIVTTTGYATADFDKWPNALRVMLVFFMFLGGCSGSTSGGLKISRIILSIKIAIRSILQAIFPNSVIPVRFNEKPLPEKMILAVLSYFVIYVSLLFFGTALFIIIESCDLVTAFTACAASFSNTGPGLVKVGPMANYAWISSPGKWILMFLMLAGRLELYSFLILLVPATWKK